MTEGQRFAVPFPKMKGEMKMTPEEYMKTLQTAADTIEAACGRAEIGVVLGSGLGDYVESLENAKSIA